MNAKSFKFTLALAASLFLSAAQAGPIIKTLFQGQVSSIVRDDNNGDFGNTFSVGNAVSGYWEFDAAAAGTNFAPFLTAYPATFSVTINGQTFSGPADYRIFNDSPFNGANDGFSVINESGTFSSPSIGSLVAETFFFQALGMPTTTLNDLSIVNNPGALFPLANPGLAPNGLRLHNREQSGDYGLLYFTINSMETVPEPSTLTLLFGAGIGFLNAKRRARSLRG